MGPYIAQQIDAIESERSGKSTNSPRDDILTWLITDAVRRKEPRKGLVDRITCRVFVAVFAAIETTTMTVSNVLLDLCSSDPTMQVWEGLAEEGSRVLSQPLDLANINSLARADSALKETLRLRTSIKALATQVTSTDGINIAGHDVKLPYGSRISISAWGVHHDEDIYASPYTFDAFRFSRPREAVQNDCTKPSDTESENAHLMVSANEYYLPFGLGRHSCPGRFFAAVEMKLFLAYLASHYDLRLAGARPEFVSIGHFPIPPMKGKLMIRRRTAPSGPGAAIL